MSRRVVVLGLQRALREAVPRQLPQQRWSQQHLSVQPQPQPHVDHPVGPVQCPAPQSRKDSRLSSEFEGSRLVGRGGFSKVVAARHRIDNQEYAIKMVTGDAVAEVRAMSAVGPHDNLIRYHACWFEHRDDSGSDTDDDSSYRRRRSPRNVLCIQLELCHQTLRTWLRHTTSREDIKRIATDVASGLAHIHSRAYAHLDLAAPNIFQRPSGSWCIGDFGLCRPMDDRLTDDGQHLYLAPERRRSELPEEGDLRKCDVYSLGVIFYELATFFHTDMERAIDLDRIASRFHNSTIVAADAATGGIVDGATFAAMLAPLPEARPHVDHVLAALST